MFKPYDFDTVTGPVDVIPALQRSLLDLGSSVSNVALANAVFQPTGLDFISNVPFADGAFGDYSTAVADISNFIQIIEGQMTELVAQAAIAAMVDNGHFYTMASQGCACCGHDHGGTQKYEVINLTNQLQAGIESGLYSPDYEGLLSAVSSITGVSVDVLQGKFDEMVTTLGENMSDRAANEPAGNDLPGNATTSGTIEVGGSATGLRDGRGDEDWFAVELEAGVTYNFIMLRSGDNPHTDPLLNLYGGDSVLIKSNDDIEFDGDDSSAENRNSWIEFIPTTSGTYYLGASGFDSANFEGNGNYTIYVEEGENRPDFTIEEAAFFLTDQFSNRQTWDRTDLTYYVENLSEGAKNLALLAFEAWEEVSGLTFTAAATAGAADIKFNENNGDDDAQQAFAASSIAGGNIVGVTITISENWTTNADGSPNYDLNSYRYQTYLHEIGHALGLGHGGPYNGVSRGAAGTEFEGTSFNVYNQDAWNYSVMSYLDQGEAETGTPRLVLGLNVVDIVAIQSLYGADPETRSGDSIYGFNSTETGIYDFDGTFQSQGIRPPSLSFYDAGGNDTLDFSGYSANQVISLIAGSFSSVGDNTNTSSATDPLVNNVSIAVGTTIENAVGGSGADVITGNGSDNMLTGNGGNDTLVGGDGNDTAVYSGNLADYTIEDLGDGTFRITGEGIDSLSGIEFAKFADQTVTLGEAPAPFTFTNSADTFTGTSGNDVIDALAGDDIVNGAGGNDVIDGNNGADQLFGDAGNDTLMGDIAFALGGVEGEVFRAYQAVFDRDPDAGGYNAFLTEIRLGNLTQLDVISEFIGSSEFQDTYGSLNNAQFVDQLFANVLPGNQDQSGRDAFTTALNDNSLSRAQVVAELANSNEFVASTRLESDSFASTIGLDPVDFQIFRLYQSVFQRNPDDGGFTAFTGSLRVGAITAESAAADFVGSNEFQDTYGALNNAQFVDQLFQNVLPGNTDQAGRDAFSTALDSGSLTRAAVVLELTNSFEFIQATSGNATTFVQTFNAGQASDTLVGGAGDDLLFGNDGADTFLFEGNDTGVDTVLDFVSGVDQIQISGVAGMDNFAAVFAASVQQGADTLITLSSGNTVLLRNITRDSLTSADFTFDASSAAEVGGKASEAIAIAEVGLSDFDDLSADNDDGFVSNSAENIFVQHGDFSEFINELDIDPDLGYAYL